MGCIFMIIITKKKMVYVSISILLIVFAYMLTGYNTLTTLKKEVETIQTVALPVDNKVIIIDARPSGFRMRELKVVLAQQKRRVI